GISSWMSTVLPTPAPPNRPTLPPFAYGASRSTTLMPVSKISRVGVRSSTSGAGRWIGQRSSTSIGSPWSIVSPSRLKIRPRVCFPTGTVIGPPVSRTSVPRCSVWACSTWSPSGCLAEPLGTRDDFHDLLCDVRLPLPVGLEREVVDQLGGVLRSVAHRGHPSPVLGRRRLEQRSVDGYLDVVRGQPLEDLLRI